MRAQGPLRPRPKGAADSGAAHEADAPGRPGDARWPGGAPGEGLAEYALRLSQQVVSLEAQTLELADARDAAVASRRLLAERAEALERENRALRDAGLATFQEGQRAVRQAGDAVKDRQGEVMLLRHEAGQQAERLEALAAQSARLEGVAERLQGERRQLHQHVLGWEATASALRAEVAEQASARAEAERAHGHGERRAQLLAAEGRRAGELAGEHHVLLAQLRLAHEELAAERGRAAQLRGELAAALGDAAAARAEAGAAASRGDALRAEALRWRHAEGAAAAAQPALQGALRHHGAAASGLRGRVGELEAAVTGLRRELTRLEAENGAVRTEWGAARADAQRWLEESAELAGQRHRAEQDAGSQERGRMAAQQHLATLASDASQMHWQREALHQENSKLWAEVRHLEAENIILRSRVRGQEVTLGR